MNVPAITMGLLGSCLVPALLHAQVGLTVSGREVQIHGFLSEGFASSTDNNYLRMDTSEGSFFTEAGLNVSSQMTDKLRVGAQVYERYIGELGKGRVYLDWAFADYRLKDWMGFRGGKSQNAARAAHRHTGPGVPAHMGAAAAVGVSGRSARGHRCARGRRHLRHHQHRARRIAFLHRLRRLDSQ